ncbi:hypothetical protein BU23DRAFT_576049 [Bimuria novae-zelandiae CBS 107.79]|uniref:J domain-containing protein n=1 Tax=Bimuria novae-zelandiae CBS 107.79 TaxID=1447943 RepID=A0A6A5UGF1_9PLEO|nr:hypothetical protein BU23DRAFT_576049 [Bimuria novae-zelandiae CBS 107.79]
MDNLDPQVEGSVPLTRKTIIPPQPTVESISSLAEDNGNEKAQLAKQPSLSKGKGKAGPEPGPSSKGKGKARPEPGPSSKGEETAGPELGPSSKGKGKARPEPGPSSKGEETAGPEPVPPPVKHQDDKFFTDRAYAEAERIVKATTPYHVLDVPPGSQEETINSAFKKKMLILHPDKTKLNVASLAREILDLARIFCIDPKYKNERAFLEDNGIWQMRIAKNGEIHNLTKAANMRTWGVEFAPNAYGGDSDESDIDMGEEEEDIEGDDKEPTEEIKELYRLATKSVKALLGQGDIKAAVESIRKINQSIPEGHKIPEERFMTMRRTKDSFKQTGLAIEKQMLDNSYDYLGLLIARFHFPPRWQDYLLKRNSGSKAANMTAADAPMADAPTADVPADVPMADAPTTDVPTGLLRHPALGICLGWIPKCAYDAAGIPFIRSFRLVFDDPFKVYDHSDFEVGSEFASQYLQLPENRKNNFVNAGWKFTKAEASNFHRIIGFSSFPSTERRMGDAYVKMLMKDGKHEVLLRSHLRRIKSKKAADQAIDEFLTSKGLRGDWHDLRRQAQLRIGGPEPTYRLPLQQAYQPHLYGYSSGSDTELERIIPSRGTVPVPMYVNGT